MTLSKIANLYLEDLSQVDLEKYKRKRGSFSHTEKLPKNIEEIKKSDLERWVAQMQKRLAPRTIKHIIAHWRQACEFCIERNLIDTNPFLKAKHPMITRTNIEPFSKNEVETMLAKANGWFECYLAFAFFTGARTCEILALQWSDIDMKNMTISISKSLRGGIVRNKTKTGVNRVVPIFSGLVPYIEKLTKDRECDWIFSYNRDHLFGSDNISLNGRWKKFLQSCGIAYRSARHTRHTFATHMVEKAVKGEFSMKCVAQILGHSSLKMTLDVYARFLEDGHLKIDRSLDIFK